MAHTSINLWALNSWKNSAYGISIIDEVICRKPRSRAKLSTHFQSKRAYNLETLGGIHKRNVTLLETSLLKNHGVCHPKIWEVYSKKVATEKHRFVANKEA